MTTEQREFIRYRVHLNQVQIAVQSGREIYSVKDIGRDGLALEYHPVPNKPFKSESIDIIAKGCNGLYIPNIICKTVYDVGILMHEQSFIGGEMRTRGLKFVGLTNEQEEKLDILLKSCFDGSGQQILLESGGAG